MSCTLDVVRMRPCKSRPTDRAVSKMAAAKTVEVLWVHSGGHNPLDTPKTQREDSNAVILQVVDRFVSGDSGPVNKS